MLIREGHRVAHSRRGRRSPRGCRGRFRSPPWVPTTAVPAAPWGHADSQSDEYSCQNVVNVYLGDLVAGERHEIDSPHQDRLCGAGSEWAYLAGLLPLKGLPVDIHAERPKAGHPASPAGIPSPVCVALAPRRSSCPMTSRGTKPPDDRPVEMGCGPRRPIGTTQRLTLMSQASLTIRRPRSARLQPRRLGGRACRRRSASSDRGRLVPEGPVRR